MIELYAAFCNSAIVQGELELLVSVVYSLYIRISAMRRLLLSVATVMSLAAACYAQAGIDFLSEGFKIAALPAAGAPGPAVTADVPTGQLTAMLPCAGAPVVAAALPQAEIYSDLMRALQKPDDGPRIMQAVRGLGIAAPIANVVREALDKALDPSHQYPDFFSFLDAAENAWALPLIQYAAGDESDEEPVYVTVNRELRSGRPGGTTIKWITLMRTALTHLPRYEGISFRGTRLRPEQLEQYYRVGKSANDLALVSTSISPETAFKFACAGGGQDAEDLRKTAVFFIVHGKTGRPVSKFANMHEHEQEILFANGTPMLVLARSPVFIAPHLGGKTVIVVLAEK